MGICSEDFIRTTQRREMKVMSKEIFTDLYNKISPNEIIHLENCLCKIKTKNLNEYGLGFFCKIPFPNESHLLPVLITNDHILEKDDISIGKNITILLKNSEEEKKIKMDKSRKTYSNDIYNITIIELKENELGNSFLEIDDNPNEKNIKNIYMLNNLNGSKKISYGEIHFINENNSTFTHLCQTKTEFLGAPIMNISNNKVMGIHKGKSETYNVGIFINNPISEFYSNIKKEEKKKNENDDSSNKSNISKKIKNNINKINGKKGDKNITKIKEDNKSENSTNNSNNSNNNINQITNTSEETKKLNKNITEEIKNENKYYNSNIPKNINSQFKKENQTTNKNNFPKNEINNQNKEISNNFNISNKEEDKEINLIFLVINKELNLDVKENIIFNKVIKQLYSKYLWLDNINIIDYKFNGKSIEKEKTVKENGLKDNSNIELVENV